MKNIKSSLLIWTGPLALTCFIIAMSCTDFAFPLSSELQPQELVSLYRAHLTGIRVASILFIFSSALMMMYAGAISAQLQRIEPHPTAWTFVQLMGGIMGNIPFALTGCIWSVALFRLDRPPEITQAITDLSWFVLELPAPTAAIQFLSIIFVVLGDRSETPIFPKWVAYLNVVATLCFLPGVTGGLFVGYPSMDWNGAITYWMPGLASASWVVLMFVALRRATRMELDRPTSY